MLIYKYRLGSLVNSDNNMRAWYIIDKPLT